MFVIILSKSIVKNKIEKAGRTQGNVLSEAYNIVSMDLLDS